MLSPKQQHYEDRYRAAVGLPPRKPTPTMAMDSADGISLDETTLTKLTDFLKARLSKADMQQFQALLDSHRDPEGHAAPPQFMASDGIRIFEYTADRSRERAAMDKLTPYQRTEAQRAIARAGDGVEADFLRMFPSTAFIKVSV